MSVLDNLSAAEGKCYSDSLDYDQLESVRAALADGQSEILYLQDELTELKERLERSQQIVTELFDRLGWHRIGVFTLDEVIAGPMVKELLTVYSSPAECELWREVCNYDPEDN